MRQSAGTPAISVQAYPSNNSSSVPGDAVAEIKTHLHHSCVGNYKMPESFRAFCKMVSLTAAKTSRIFVVSVA